MVTNNKRRTQEFNFFAAVWKPEEYYEVGDSEICNNKNTKDDKSNVKLGNKIIENNASNEIKIYHTIR